MRELIAADVERVMDDFTSMACGIVNTGTGKEHSAQLLFLQMSDDQPGEVAKVAALDPVLVMAMQENRIKKDAMTALVRHALGGEGEASPIREGLRAQMGLRPDMAVFINEAWVAKTTPEAYRAGHRPAPSEQPDRSEALVVMVHVKEHTYTNILPITGKGKERHVESEPFKVAPSEKAAPLGGALTMQGWDDMPEGRRAKDNG